jgi:hypothetical protein
MADRPSEPTDDQTGVGPASDRPPATPRWAKIFWIIAAVVILLVLIVLLTRGPHGPGRHMGPAGGGGETPASSITEHRPPPGIPNHGG